MKKLLAIVGPTASGKSALGMAIARRFKGEIICADSRTVYKEMDIGTAKPSAADQAVIPHHLLDVVKPNETFTAARFKELAGRAVTDIQAKGHLPILVGGTGLYIDSVLYGYEFPPENAELRAELKELTKEQLQTRVRDLGISLNDSDYSNPPRLIRAIETAGQPRGKSQLPPNTLIIGLSVPRTELEKRIRARILEMLKAGLIKEVSDLVGKYGAGAPGLNGIGYRAFAEVNSYRKSIKEAIEDFARGDLGLAKRQMTWFKRNPDIHWVASPAYGLKLAESFLSRL